MEASTKPLTQIFDRNLRLEIPYFQRSYVWKQDLWERFLIDLKSISESKNSYFFGAIILKQKDTQTGEGEVRSVIDGQQRLTTFCIFLKAMSILHDEPEFEQYITLMGKDKKPAIDHNYNDKETFEEILSVKNKDDVTKIKSSSKILEIFKYFLYQHKDTTEIDAKELDIYAILRNVKFVVIDLAPTEDEQQIFDTINSIGERLSTADLLKNYLFARSSTKSIDFYNDNWRDIFEKDEDTKEYWDKEISVARMKRNNIDWFLYSFLQIKIQDQPLSILSSDKETYSRFQNLFSSYKKFIEKYIGKEKLSDFIGEMKEYALTFKENFDTTHLSRTLPSEMSIDRMNVIAYGLDTITVIPYLLFVCKNVKEDNERNQIFGYLESYLMRRLICKSTNKSYSDLFSNQLIGNHILTLEKLRKYIDDRSEKNLAMPTDENLKLGFHNESSVNRISKGILYLLESKCRDENYTTILDGIENYTLEHVMPKKWEAYWNDVNKNDEQKKAKRNRKLLTLGNLTILSSTLNGRIKNKSWRVKKSGDGRAKGLSHYAQGLETFSSFLSEKTWNEEVIEKRADFLYDIAIKFWRNN